MVAGTQKARTGEGAFAAKPALDVVLLYEDLGTALRAKCSLDRLSRRLSAESGWRTRIWRLDLLGEPLLAEQAAIEAAAADIIILSLHGHQELRVETRTCLSRWLSLKAARPYALAVLLDPDPSRPDSDRPVFHCLKRIALAAHADLFCTS